MAGDAAASALAFAQALGQLQAAKMADAEASTFAAQTGATLMQAKAALAAASRQAAQAAQAEAAATKAAAREVAAAAKESAAAKKAADREAAASAKAVVKEQEAAAKAAEQAAKKQKKAAKDAADAAKEAADAQKQAAKDWNDSGDAMTHPLDSVRTLLKGLGPEGQAAAVAIGFATAGITALSAAIIGGMTTAIGVVEKMTERLSIFSALGGSAAAGKATMDMVGKLSERLPFSTDQLAKWAQTMQRAGIQGKSLEGAVKAIAAAAALNPEGGAAAAENMLAKLNGEGKGAAAFLKQIQQEGGRGEKTLREMGLTMADLGGKAAVAKMSAKQLAEAAKSALTAKGAGRLETMGNTFEVIAMKAKAGLMGVFSGLDKSVEPFMGSVKGLFAMFNRGGPMVAILKPIVTSVFSTLFSWAKRAVDFVHSAFQQIVIAGLKVRIAIQPIVVAFRQFSAEVSKAIAASGLFQGKSTALSAVLGFLKTILVNTFLMGVVAITGFVRFLAAMASAAAFTIGKVRSIFKGLTFPNLAGAAGNMITSFIAGILGKIGSVVSAMRGMGQAAKAGLLGALGIASPSKVALEAAGNVTSTFSDKVDDGKPAAQKAFDGFAKAPGSGKGAGGGGKGGAGADLVAALERVATALEMSPGMREAMQLAFLEAAQEGGLA